MQTHVRLLTQTVFALTALTHSAAYAQGPDRPPNDMSLYVPDGNLKAGSLIQIPAGSNPGGDAATLKLLIVHTSRFVSSLSSSDPDLIEFMQLSVAAVNQYFANTGLATRVEISGIVEWGRSAGFSLQSDLEALPEFVESQTRLRDKTGADFVQLWELQEPGIDQEGLCGWGQIVGSDLRVSTAGYGYSGVMRSLPGIENESCYSSSTPETFALLVAHEIGHNLGSAHDWSDTGVVGAYEFARGTYCGTTNSSYQSGTIMSQSKRRLPYFSTTHRSNDGQVCGRDESSPYPSNNREAFTRTASVMATLRSDPPGRGTVSLAAPSSIAEYSEWLPVFLTRSNSDLAAAVELLTYSYGTTRDLDFVMPYRVRVEFLPGQSRVVVPVTLLGDDRREGTEQLRFWIQAGENVRISSQRTKLVTVRDNEWPAMDEILPSLDSVQDHSALGTVTEAVNDPQVSASAGDAGGGIMCWWLFVGGLLLLVYSPGRIARL